MNQVTLDPNGFIRQALIGDQDEATITDLEIKTRNITKELQANKANAPVNFLVDLRGTGRQTVSARRASLSALKELPYHKIALFGAHRFIRHVVNLIIVASRQQAKVKYFEEEAAAIAWLKK